MMQFAARALPPLHRSVLSSMILVAMFSFVTILSQTAQGQELPLPVEDLKRTKPVNFATEVQPILKRNCLACHHEKEAEGGLVLETIKSILKGGDSGNGVVAKNLDESLLFTRAVGSEEPLMPPEDNSVGAAPLTPTELGLLKLWIQEGAKGSDAAMSAAIDWQPIPKTIRSVYATDLSPDGRFAVVGRGNRVMVVDLESHQPTASLIDHSLTVGEVTDVDLVQSVAVSPDAQRIATGGFRTVRIWRKDSAEIDRATTPLADSAGLIAIKPDHSAVAFVNAIGDIEVWGFDDNQLRVTLSGMTDPIADLAWGGNSDRLFSGDEMGRLAAWDTSSGKLLAEFNLQSAITALSAATDASHVAAVDATGKAQLLQLSKDGAKLERLSENLAGLTDVTAIAMTTKPSLTVIAARQSGTVTFIAAAGEKVIRELQHGAAVDAVTVSNDESKVVTGGRDGKTRLWNLADGKSLITTEGDTKTRLLVASRTRDAERQKGTVTRLTKKTEELNQLLTKESEALKKVTEEHKKAVDALAAEEKKRTEAVAVVTATDSKISKAAADTNAAKKAIEDATKTLTTAKAASAEVTKQIEAKKAELAAAKSAATKAEQQIAEITKVLNAEKAKADAIQKQIDESNTKLQKSTLAAATAQTQIDSSNATIVAAKKITDASTKELEAQKKAVATADAARKKSEGELAKRKQALATATSAQKRATDAVPAHQLLIEAETRRQQVLDQKLNETRARMTTAGNEVTDVSIAADGLRIVTAHADGTVRVYRTSDGVPTAVYQSGNRTPLRVAEWGQKIVGFAASTPPTVWSTQTNWVLERTIGSVDDPSIISDRVTAIDFRPDGLSIAVGSGPPSRSGEVKVFDVRSGRLVRDFGEVHSDTVLGLEFSPDGRMLASSAADKTIRLLDLTTGKVTRSLEGHTHHVLSVAWQDDGQTLASASADQTIKIWNTETGEQRRTISGFSKEMTSVAFLNTTSHLLTTCADGQVRLYDSTNGKLIRSFNAAGDFLYTVSVTSDGKQLVAGGQSGKVRFWNVSDAKVLGELE